MVASLILVFGGLIGFNLFKQYKIKQFFETFKLPPATISTIIAKSKNWQPTLTAVGNFVAVNGVDVNAQQSGHVTKIYFTSGEHVQKGQTLLELDKTVDSQSLAEAKANLELSKNSYDRQKALYKTSATSTSTLDAAESNLENSMAAVNKIQAILDQKTIRAPFDGKLGLRNVNLGQFVTPGATHLVTLQSQDPLFLQFYLPEQYLPHIHKGQKLNFKVEAYPDHIFEGTIEALNAKVDSTTHNILVQAKVANCPNFDDIKKPHHYVKSYKKNKYGMTQVLCDTDLNKKNHVKAYAFIAGMFANIEVMKPVIKNTLVLPRTAISFSLYGNSVYLVKKSTDPITKQVSLKVFQTFVKTGEEKGNEVVVLSGVKAGDEVVNSGQLKLQNGTDVIINNDVTLDEETNIKRLGQ